MKSAYSYLPSKLIDGEAKFLREHSFTRWMSRDLLQPASDFLRNLSLMPLYVECSPQNEHRYLLWHPPEGYACEVRSGRTLAQFTEYDNANIDRGWQLLSLQINESAVYSAVWVSADHLETAKRALASYGILPASRMLRT